jgi:parvulin-like peptidyl-prolyl isomerase
MIGRRILGALFVAGAGVLAASGCASTLSDAATLRYRDSRGDHTEHISRSDLQDQVSALVGNKALRPVLQRTYAVGEADTNTDAKLTALWLTQLIRNRAVDAEFKSQGLQLRPEDVTAATNEVQQNYTPDVFNKLPKSMRDQLVTSQAQIDALLRSCASGRSVSHVLVKTKAQAEAALARLKAGVPFATVAKQVSNDTGSKGSGGQLGCLGPDEFVPAFQTAAENAQVGVVTQPVHTQFGYHLILVQPWDPQLASNPQYAQSLQQGAGAALDARLADLGAHIDPRYGTWGQQQTQNGKAWVVIPPAAPDVHDKRT